MADTATAFQTLGMRHDLISGLKPMRPVQAAGQSVVVDVDPVRSGRALLLVCHRPRADVAGVPRTGLVVRTLADAVTPDTVDVSQW